MTLTALLRRAGILGVPHGFRSSLRDWSAKRSGTDAALRLVRGEARLSGCLACTLSFPKLDAAPKLAKVEGRTLGG